MTIISTYAPTLVAPEDKKDKLNSSLTSFLLSLDCGDKVALMIVFNDRVGSNCMVWKGVLGRHGCGKMNGNSLRLL